MPTRSEWAALARETFHALDREDVTDFWSVDWKRASSVFLADHRNRIEAEPRRWKRAIRKSSAVLYGLIKRLTPRRRLVFVVALFFALLSIGESNFGSSDGAIGIRIDLMFVAFLLATVLLGMELVDKLHFRSELDLARELQASLIPRRLPEPPGFTLGAYNRIANTVGGDVYDFAPLPDGRLAMLFGDASGHGMAAGILMAVAHAAFRTQLLTDPSPAAVGATLNRILCGTGAPRSFFAGIALLLSPDGGFTALVAGHPPILRVDGGGRVMERLGAGSYPLGIKETSRWAILEETLAPGEALLFHSDGLPEAQSAAGVEFGDARIEAVLARRPGASAPDLVGALAAELAEFLGRTPPEDDVSIAAIRRSV